MVEHDMSLVSKVSGPGVGHEPRRGAGHGHSHVKCRSDAGVIEAYLGGRWMTSSVVAARDRTSSISHP
jgi:ABC-type branched-subunit amino acid transport system ATPase component